MGTVSKSELREQLHDVIGRVQHTGDWIEVTHHGKPVVVIIPADVASRCEDLLLAAAADEAERESDERFTLDEVERELLDERSGRVKK